MKKLFIYGTIFNNAEWVADSIASLERLKPEWIMITDAGSTDGTKEILQDLANRYGNILVEEYKGISRGKGRQEALNNIYNVAEDSDLVMYADFDEVYSDFMVNYIKRQKVKDMEAYCFGLMTIKTSKLAEWKDLNYGEDWEWFAHLKSLNVNIKDYIKEGDNRWVIRQRQGIGIREREAYYKKSKLKLFYEIIESHKGMAYKNWTGDAKHTTSKIANIIAHILAYPYYSYDKKLNNRDYVCQQ